MWPATAVAPIRHKQIARAVKGQSIRVTQPGGKGGSHSARSKFIDVAAALIRHKQIACAVKGQTTRSIQPGGKGASRSAGSEFIDVAASNPPQTDCLRCQRPDRRVTHSTRRQRCFALRRSEFIDVAFESATNRLPALSKARPSGPSNPEAKVLDAPFGVNL